MLTEREIAVLKMKVMGLTQAEIATHLNIAQPSVSKFYNNALNKIKDAKEVLKLEKKLGVKDE